MIFLALALMFFGLSCMFFWLWKAQSVSLKTLQEENATILRQIERLNVRCATMSAQLDDMAVKKGPKLSPTNLANSFVGNMESGTKVVSTENHKEQGQALGLSLQNERPSAQGEATNPSGLPKINL